MPAAATPTPTSLPREVLRWVQSLDLAYSVKNPKRDFANGFLIAEIFSRYYPSDIQMHSYENGFSTKIKKDNWAQLMLFFIKRNIQLAEKPISQLEVDAILHCRGGAAIEFVTKLYELLTGRRVQRLAPPTLQDDTPPFARPTATAVLRDTMNDPEFQVTDRTTMEAKLKETLESHERDLQTERTLDPARFSTTNASRHAKVLRGQTRTVGSEETKESVTVKKVNVKAVDGNVAQLRANKEMHATSSARLAGQTSVSASRSVLNMSGEYDAGAGGAAAPVVVARPVLDILNGIVSSAVAGTDLARTIQDSRSGAAVRQLSLVGEFTHSVVYQMGYADAVRSGVAISEEVAAQVLGGVHDHLDAIVECCVTAPTEAWKVASFFQPLLAHVSELARSFHDAVGVFVAFGDAFVQHDAAIAYKVLEDCVLRGMLAIITAFPAKRQAALQIVYAFATADVRGHAQTIRLLQQALNDMTVFLHCLTFLIFFEPPDCFEDPAFLDVYMYYCHIAIGMSSPQLRAAAVGMMAVIAASKPELAAAKLDAVAALQDDAWWEVRAQLGVLVSELLNQLPGDVDASQDALSIAHHLLSVPNAPSTARVVLSYMAKVLDRYPVLLQPYVSTLLSLPAASRNALLEAGPSEDLPVVAGSGLRYSMDSITSQWPAPAVAQALADYVHDNSLQHLEIEHFQLLEATLVTADFDAQDADWVAVFKALQDHILVALCDAECIASALHVLQIYVYNSSLGDSIFQIPSFLGSVLLMHKSNPKDRDSQQQLANFLTAVAAHGASSTAAVRDLLQRFKLSSPDSYAASALSAVRL